MHPTWDNPGGGRDKYGPYGRGMMLEIRLIVRAAHTIAAAAWVGGSIFYLVVVLPALRIGGPAPAVAAQVAVLFKRMVNICIGVLLLTGCAECVKRRSGKIEFQFLIEHLQQVSKNQIGMRDINRFASPPLGLYQVGTQQRRFTEAGITDNCHHALALAQAVDEGG